MQNQFQTQIKLNLKKLKFFKAFWNMVCLTFADMINFFQGRKMNKPETGITPEVKQALVSVSLLSVFILVMSSIFGGIFLSM